MLFITDVLYESCGVTKRCVSYIIVSKLGLAFHYAVDVRVVASSALWAFARCNTGAV